MIINTIWCDFKDMASTHIRWDFYLNFERNAQLMPTVYFNHTSHAGVLARGRENRIVNTSVIIIQIGNIRKLPQFWHFCTLTHQLWEHRTKAGFNLGVGGMCGVWDEWGWDG